jgi:hypothetical protein
MSIPVDFLFRHLKLNYVNPDELIRIFRTPSGAHPAPIYYGNSAKYRFDCPAPVGGSGTYGVAYAAFDLATCFAETVTRDTNRQPLQRGGIAVSLSGDIAPRFVAKLQGVRFLRLADVTDVGLYGLGAEAGEFNSIDYAISTQPWSLELFKRSETVDGLLYRSRFLNGRLATAIFERGGSAVSLGASHVTPLVRHPDFAATLSELNICLLP